MVILSFLFCRGRSGFYHGDFDRGPSLLFRRRQIRKPRTFARNSHDTTAACIIRAAQHTLPFLARALLLGGQHVSYVQRDIPQPS